VHRRAWGTTLLVVALGLGVPDVAAPACSDLFPKLTAAVRLAPDDLLLYLGTDNFLNVATIPSINTFDPNLYTPPTVIEPGFTPLVVSIRLDPTLIPTLKWFLDCQILVIDAANIPDDLLLPAPTAGPAGPAGPQGPTGPPGPPGNSNTFPSSLVHTFPHGGVLTIEDVNVTSTSVILLQYVGGGGNPSELIVQHVEAGQFIARGRAGRQFRYVVFN
jgi:hypothetical protein